MKVKPLFSLVSSLSGVTRFSMLKQVHKENVLEHTGMIAIFAYVLGTRLNHEGDFQFDMTTLLQKAIVHDWDESITGDVARPTKYYSSTLRNEMAALEADGIDNLSSLLVLPRLSETHSEAKEGAEGSLVALCDIACAIHRCWEETLIFNNMHFTLPARRLLKVLGRTDKKLNENLKMMNSEQWHVLNTFVLDLHDKMEQVLKAGNNELAELAHAD